MPTVIANPNWPAMGFDVDATGGPPNRPGASRRSLNAAYERLAVRQWSAERGRQFELDQAQAGTLTARIDDPLELLNENNPASAFNTGANSIAPYRCYQCWAIWPNQPGSGNLMAATTDVLSDPSFEAAVGPWSVVGGATTAVLSATQHFVGVKALSVTQSAAGAGFGVRYRGYTTPGLTYTFSCYVYPTSGSVTAQVTDASGAVTSSATVSTLNTWTRLTLTWNAVDTAEAIVVFGTVTATPTFYLDAVQLEFGAVLNAFTTSGPTLYPQFTGYVERWPTSYDMAGLRSYRELVTVDAMAILARTAISWDYNAEIAVDSPALFVPLSNKTQPTSGGALSAGSEASSITPHNIGGNPAFVVPSNGSIAWSGDQHPDGTPAAVFSITNSQRPPIPTSTSNTVWMNVINTAYSLDTTNGAVVEFWARPTTGAMCLGGMYTADPYTNTNYATYTQKIAIEVQGGGLSFVYNPDSANQFGYVLQTPGGVHYPDGKWHYFAFTFSSAGWTVMFDDVESGINTPAGQGRLGFTVLSHFGADAEFGDPQAQVSAGRWAVYPTAVSYARRLVHYNRGVGYINEWSGDRVVRLLNQYYAGAASVAAGWLQMAPDFNYDGRVLLDVLQEIQESERGLTYVNRQGTVIWEDRLSRYTNQAALWVFGENPSGANPTEYPYHDYASVLDPTYTFSQSNLSRPGNASFQPVVNATTQAKYGQRILSQTVQTNTDYDLSQAAVFYNQRYSVPKTRIVKLSLKPSANPALWPVVLSLEISQRIKVKRRNSGVTVTAEYYVEKIHHQVNADTGDWMVELQCSPVFVPSAWVLGDSTKGVLGTTTYPVY